MLQIYDINHVKSDGLTTYKDLKIDKEINIEDNLSFLFPVSDSKYALIQEECYIRTEDNEYIVKEVNFNDDDWTEYICKINIEGIKGKDISHFETVEQSCINSVNLALVGTGWTIGTCDVAKLRTVRKNNCTAYIVLQEIQSAYGCEMAFDSINKKVYIYQSMGSDKGTYFAEQLNLKKLDVQRNSYDYITRLIPLGKDGLGIASINDGLNYIQNSQYSNKVITAYWEDNRYTDAQSLFEDGIVRLDYLSKPYAAYKAEVIDLANINTQYAILDYSLGDTITLLAKSKNTKEQQRIIKLTEYPDEPERNTCEIANKILSLEYLQVRFVDTANTVDTVTTVDGLVDGSKVDGIDWSQLQNVHIVIADIQDLSVVTARIGTLETTTAHITNGIIDNATIDMAKVNDLFANYAHITDGIIDNAVVGTAAIGTTQIADGSITDAKIITLTANKINAGTLSVERLEIRGSTTSIVYAINSITGALQAENVDTLNGEILTPRSITADRIVAASITGNEIAAHTITANNILANTITANEIAVATITADKIAAHTITGDQIAAGSITAENVNIQVGGRNYVLNSNVSSSSSETAFAFSSIGLWQNKTITVSVDIELVGATGSRIGFEPSIIFSDNSVLHTGCWFTVGATPVTIKKRISATWVVPDKVIIDLGQKGMYVQCTGTTTKVSNPKLELGNTPTDWTPAPEDLGVAGATTINGANIITGTITADKINTTNLTVFKVITSGNPNSYLTMDSTTQSSLTLHDATNGNFLNISLLGNGSTQITKITAVNNLQLVASAASSGGIGLDTNNSWIVSPNGTSSIKLANNGTITLNAPYGVILGDGDNLLLLAYPVGSIYLSTISTNPNILFGGTWVAWGTGRVPVGINTADNNFNTVEKTGGTPTETLDGSKTGPHVHNIGHNNGGGDGANYSGGPNNVTFGFTPSSVNSAGVYQFTALTSGGGAAHNNLPPYITCYMFKRTA